MYNLNYTKADVRAMREEIKAVNSRVDETIGTASGMDQFQFAAYGQLQAALFTAATLLHTFWTVAPEKADKPS